MNSIEKEMQDQVAKVFLACFLFCFLFCDLVNVAARGTTPIGL